MYLVSILSRVFAPDPHQHKLSNLETFKDNFELRDRVKSYRDDDVDQPRICYEEEDAVKIMELLKDKGSSFALDG